MMKFSWGISFLAAGGMTRGRKKQVRGGAPDRAVRPQGKTVRRPGVRVSGLEGEGAKWEAVSRPEQSGVRVTATAEEGRHACVAPTRRERINARSLLSPTLGGDRGGRATPLGESTLPGVRGK